MSSLSLPVPGNIRTAHSDLLKNSRQSRNNGNRNRNNNQPNDKFVGFKGGNAGLLFEKWGAGLNFSKGKFDFHKDDWIANACKGSIGQTSDLERAAERQKKLIDGQSGKCLHGRVDGALAIGLGIQSPVENGFVFHPTLGVPYIPGSSIKGAVRAWVNDWLAPGDKEEAEKLLRLLGPEREASDPIITNNSDAESTDEFTSLSSPHPLNESAGHAGSVIFLDALPIKPVQMQPDVLTPHYGKSDTRAQNWPTDWISPVPVPFMSVKQGASFQFGLIPRTSCASEDLETVKCWLKDAATHIGLGAKTSRGYGRFSW